MKTAGTPLGAIGRGLIAGAVGSLAMDVLWYARYRRGYGGSQAQHQDEGGTFPP